MTGALLDAYPYAANVPVRGLYIDGRPALSGIDPDRVGDHVIVTVRDPLCAYGADPAEQIASKLDDAEPIGRTGMFSTWTGGSICSVADNISTGAKFVAGTGHTAAIDVALAGLALLHRMDAEAAAAGLPMWLPEPKEHSA